MLSFQLFLQGVSLDLLRFIGPPQFFSIFIDPGVYPSGDVWNQMLEKEKERVRKLEDHFAEKMKAKGVSFLRDGHNCIVTSNRDA